MYPSVIDNILLNHPGVDDVATIAAKRPVVGDVPYCFIVSSDTSDTFEAGARQTLSSMSFTVFLVSSTIFPSRRAEFDSSA